jgi:RimJ/RimL family protein N-acetyltransferase
MKVIIRKLKPEDAEVSYKWRNDPEIWKLTGRKWKNQVTKEMEENWIKEVIQQGDSLRFAICVGEEEKYIGNVQLTNITKKDAVSHIFIGEKQYWGMGLGTIATKLLIDYARNNLQIKKIKASVNKKNFSSIRLMEKIGYKFSHYADDDHYIMEYILKPD